MAYDSIPWNDPDKPVCPKCARSISKHEPTTIMYFPTAAHGDPDMNGKPWHAECARPYWDKLTPLLESLKRLGGAF